MAESNAKPSELALELGGVSLDSQALAAAASPGNQAHRPGPNPQRLRDGSPRWPAHPQGAR